LLAEKFSNAFGKPFVVENVPGAGGIVAANMVAKAPPDGHVLMFGDSGALAINPALNPSLGYDPIKDFAPVTALVSLPTIMVANPAVPANTLAEFIALARKDPGKMSFGSAGAGSIHHLTMAIFADRTGIDLLHVPYRGGSAMVNGLLTGEIHVGWSGIPNVMTLIESGKLRGYCVSVLQRSPSTPAIPTCDELGQKAFDVATVMGIHAPAGTPAKVVARLQAEAAAVMREPAMAARMQQLGMVMQENGTANYKKFMLDDMERYAAVIQKLNLQIR
jgi:tripartite-type tricarboxylate transporter receptor subunit TctC